MPGQGPLRWVDGEGWLVLLGGGDCIAGATDQVDAQILSIVNLDRPMLVLLSDGRRSLAEGILEHFTELGGPGGEAYTLADMTREQLASPGFLRLLDEIGLLYLGGENPLPLVRNLYDTPALSRIVQAFQTLQGLTIAGAAGGAAALGAWIVAHGAPEAVEGIGFVLNAAIVPHFVRTEESPLVQRMPQGSGFMLGLGIPDSTALALGPQGQVETWGDGQVTAVLKVKEDTGDSQ